MKKTLVLAGFTTLLFACNSNSNHSPDNTDSTIRHNTNPDTSNKNQTNAVTATMNKMMHEMHGAKPTGNNEIDFATMMLEHHKGAVEMSEVEVNRGSDPELKGFAQKVIDEQNKEIEFMRQFISNASKTKSPYSADFQKALNGSMMAMMKDNIAFFNNIDKDYATQMIPHHQSAVDMAKAYLQYGKETSLTTLCHNVISSQEKEINWLKDWLLNNK
jgi:uncharacterized protein (DUF305 family)